VAGRYRLVRMLGAGGMGTVWEARDELLGRDVAIKEVAPPPELTEDEADLLRRRTVREASTAARISHPNVTTVYDVVTSDDEPWIVMELVPSRSLSEVIAADGPMPPARVAQIGLDVLAALRTAHAAGVLHRDVKPGNVLLRKSDGRAVLTDFGIATLAGDPSLTKAGLLLGAPAYISPERARGGRGDPSSDLWALGATLYTAVEGRPPHDRGGPLPTLAALVTEDPPPPRHAGDLRPALVGMLRMRPADRLASAEIEALLRPVAASRAPHNLTAAPRPAAPSPAPAAGTAPVPDPTGVLPELPPAPAGRGRGVRGKLAKRTKATPPPVPPGQGGRAAPHPPVPLPIGRPTPPTPPAPLPTGPPTPPAPLPIGRPAGTPPPEPRHPAGPAPEPRRPAASSPPATEPRDPRTEPRDPRTGPAAQPRGTATGPTAQPHGPATGPADRPHGPTTGPTAQPRGPRTGPAAQPRGPATERADQPHSPATGPATGPATQPPEPRRPAATTPPRATPAQRPGAAAPAEGVRSTPKPPAVRAEVPEVKPEPAPPRPAAATPAAGPEPAPAARPDRAAKPAPGGAGRPAEPPDLAAALIPVTPSKGTPAVSAEPAPVGPLIELSRQRLVAAVVVLVLVGVLGTVALLTRGDDRPSAQPGPGTSAPPAGSSHPRGSAPAKPASSAPKPPPSTVPPGQKIGLVAFAIDQPQFGSYSLGFPFRWSWTKQRQSWGGTVTFRANDGHLMLLMDHAITAAPDALEDLKAKETSQTGGPAPLYPNYHRIRLDRPSALRQAGADIAIWEFTYTDPASGTPMHALFTNVGYPDSRGAYGLLWRGTQASWDADAGLRQQVQDSWKVH
jgi:eukaryotic-like serine/threonine-protein kinase